MIFEGFFGNGTICYDIDECQWDQNAKDQVKQFKRKIIQLNF